MGMMEGSVNMVNPRVVNHEIIIFLATYYHCFLDNDDNNCK